MLASVATAFAGNIRDVEYWFDSAINLRVREHMDSDSLSMKVNTPMLTPGLHTFHIQPIDSAGKRGSLHSTPLWVSAEPVDTAIRAYGVWIDSRLVKLASVDSLHVVDCLDVASMSPGFHSVALAPYKAGTIPGKLQTSVFFIPQPAQDDTVEVLLIWQDNDLSTLTAVADNALRGLPVDISGLLSGLHFINVLPVTNDGRAGALYRSAFFLPKIDYPEVGAYKYWIDDNPPVESGRSSTPLQIPVDVKSLASGAHTFNIQGMSPEGEWGEVYSVAFEMPVDLDLTDWEIVKALHEQLTAIGWESPWKMEDGPAGAVTFSGLTSREGRVTGIHLDHLGTEGAFPMAALQFPKLTELNLSHNGLSGDVNTIIGSTADEVVAPELRSIDLSDNRLSGNVSLLAVRFPELTELNLADNGISEVNPPLPAGIEKLDLARQIVGDTAILNLSYITAESLAETIPSIFTYRHDPRDYDTEYELILAPQPPYRIDWYNTAISGLKVSKGESLSISPIGYDNALRVPEGGVMMLGRLTGGVAANPSRLVKVEYVAGDVDFTGGLGPADVQATILYVFDEYGWRPFNFAAADTYSDGVINVQDVVVTVNLLLDKTSSMTIQSRVPLLEDVDKEIQPEATLYYADGKIILESAEGIGAIALSALGDVSWCFSDFGLETASNDRGVVAYSLSGGAIPAGRHIIGEYTGDVAISSVRGSTLNAEEIRVDVMADSSSAEIISADEEATYVYPDGTVSNAPRRGVNIVIIGGKPRKVLVK